MLVVLDYSAISRPCLLYAHVVLRPLWLLTFAAKPDPSVVLVFYLREIVVVVAAIGRCNGLVM